jgi:hypothetical protein
MILRRFIFHYFHFIIDIDITLLMMLFISPAVPCPMPGVYYADIVVSVFAGDAEALRCFRRFFAIAFDAAMPILFAAAILLIAFATFHFLRLLYEEKSASAAKRYAPLILRHFRHFCRRMPLLR